MEKSMEIRGPVGDWHALRSNPDYKADWLAHGAAPPVVESAGFALCAQAEADLEAVRWGLLAWEDPPERSRFKPFWIDEKMHKAVVVESGDPMGPLVRATGMNVSGLRLLDGALVLKVKKWRRVEQIRVTMTTEEAELRTTIQPVAYHAGYVFPSADGAEDTGLDAAEFRGLRARVKTEGVHVRRQFAKVKVKVSNGGSLPLRLPYLRVPIADGVCKPRYNQPETD